MKNTPTTPVTSSTANKPTRLKLTPRLAAWRILTAFEAPDKPQKKHTRKNRIKVDAQLNKAIQSEQASHWGAQDKALLTTLSYGTLRHGRKLEHILTQLSHFAIEKINPDARSLLKLGLFQLHCLDAIPEYAAINSTVELAKSGLSANSKLSPKTVSLINGILRAYQRQNSTLISIPWSTTDEEVALQHLKTVYGLPLWWLERLQEHHSLDALHTMAKTIQTPPPLSIRINTLKTSISDYQAQLKAQDIQSEPIDPNVPECLILKGSYGSPINLPSYSNGHFMVQGINSARIAHQLNVQAGHVIVDLCAAPGSKTTHIAAQMQNTGTLYAIEPSEKRIKQLEQNLDRLGVTIVNIIQKQGEDFNLPDGILADRILIDAPCSGLGTVRNHPEILWQIQASELLAYQKLQKRLLTKGITLLKPGGELIYSTCSLTQEENDDVVQAVLSLPENSNLTLTTSHTDLITEDGDGFYLAKISKAL